ncbi:MAG TPA: helix-turn-helix domain-containing protein, partial [Alphaproteobacteria bacterium]|nr:helix-turn-helix domain-containing protein [Alphaproteobacteria bacterium]
MITIQQVKAARALLDWTQSDLADQSNISLPAIARLEQAIGNPRSDTVQAIRDA